MAHHTYNATSCHTAPHHTTPHRIIPCHAMPYHTLPYGCFRKPVCFSKFNKSYVYATPIRRTGAPGEMLILLGIRRLPMRSTPARTPRYAALCCARLRHAALCCAPLNVWTDSLAHAHASRALSNQGGYTRPFRAKAATTSQPVTFVGGCTRIFRAMTAIS